MECDAKPKIARRLTVPRSLGREMPSVVREAFVQVGFYSLLRTRQTSGVEYSFQAANAEDTLLLKVGTMWRPQFKLILRICGALRNL